MRIILVGSVSTVKRLRVLLGTLVAIEATADAAPTIATHSLTSSEDADVIAEAGFVNGGADGANAAHTAAAESAINRAFEAVDLIHRLMHPTADGSDLARINSARLHEPTKVHASVGYLLNLARRINTLTDGTFDPCTPAQSGRLSDIEVSSDETEVVCHAPVALDLGGFAKGYAVDCAIETLIAAGCTSGLVNAGGDMRVFGQRTEPVFVRGPAGELASIELNDAALAVSDVTAQQRPPEHQGYYVRNYNADTPYVTAYAAVIANTTAVADALAKCVLLCAPQVAARTLSAFGASTAL